MCSINKGKGKIKKPNLDAQIQEFALNMGNIRIPCLWTYHPGYYKGFKIDDVLEKIDNTI